MSAENMETKEDIKKVIDKSTDYRELYDNAILVLKRMEATFKDSLEQLSYKENLNAGRQIRYLVFDDKLNINNPVTIFEKKGAELLKRSKDIAENNTLLNAGIRLAKRIGVTRLDSRSKQIITDELWNTRINAINDFKSDIADGILSNKNNVDLLGADAAGSSIGSSLVMGVYRRNHKEFEEKINGMPLLQLTYTTFHMYEGATPFKYCYKILKEKLGNKNLFDYIDSLKKNGDQTSEILKYSALKMLFHQGEADDLKKWVDNYKGKENLLKYIRTRLAKDESFTEEFLTGMIKLEKVPYFKAIANELKQKDPKVRQAAERTKNFDKVDAFKSKKVNVLAIYGDESHGGGRENFASDFESYKSQGFGKIVKEDNNNYTKYVLEKGVDKVTMIKIKDDVMGDSEALKKVLSGIVQEDFNLFALRGHYWTTKEMASALGGLRAVKEDDIFIDGGCWNAQYTGDYYHSGIKGQMFAYKEAGHGDSSQAFINNIIQWKSQGKSFSDLVNYYNTLNNESTLDGYFAKNVERPDTIEYNYRIIKGK